MVYGKEIIENKFERVAEDQIVGRLKCVAEEFGLYSYGQKLSVVND
jgi:hypothetical protein